MSACEKCWGDAFVMSIHSGYSQVECYNQLLKERKDYTCTAREQAGQFWDEENQCDRRLL